MSNKSDSAPRLRITSLRDGFRRAGRAWHGVTEIDARALGAARIAALKVEPRLTVEEIDEKAPSRISIEDGIGRMLEADPHQADSDLWTRSGKPDVAALERVLGYDISAAERDAAWSAIRSGGE